MKRVIVSIVIIAALVISCDNKDIAGINSRIDLLESKPSLDGDVESLRNDVDNIIASVQSIVAVPDFSDGAVRISESEENVLGFEVYPLTAAKNVVEIGKSAFQLDCVETETKSSMFTNIPVSDVSFNGEVVQVTVDGSGLRDEIKDGEQKVNARLKITDNMVTRSSDYFPLKYVLTDSTLMVITPESLSFDSSNNLSKNVEVVSRRNWKVTSSVDWISVSIDGKSIEGETILSSQTPVTLTVTVTENTGFERGAQIVLSGGSIARSVLNVSQKSAVKQFSVADVRAMNPNPFDNTTVDIEDGVAIKGYVTSDRNLNNLTSTKGFYIQDSTGGLFIFCSGNHNLELGDQVVLDLSGSKLEYFNAMLEVSGLSVDRISRLSSGNVIEPIKVSVADFKANKYESQYIELLEDVQVAESALGMRWVSGNNHTSIDVVASNGETFVVRSSKYSSFGSDAVAQGSGKIRGIASIYNDGMQIIFGQESDWSGLTNERFKIDIPKVNSSRISEILKASAGADVELDSAVVVATSSTDLSYPSATFLVTDGGRKDYLVVYGYGGKSPAVGDIIHVRGTLSTYGKEKRPQISGPVVSILSSGGTFEYPQPEDVTDDFDNFGLQEIKHISVKGTYTLSENKRYQVIKVNGSSKGCALLTPDAIDVDSFMDRPDVTFTGYNMYTNSNYMYLILTDVKVE